MTGFNLTVHLYVNHRYLQITRASCVRGFIDSDCNKHTSIYSKDDLLAVEIRLRSNGTSICAMVAPYDSPLAGCIMRMRATSDNTNEWIVNHIDDDGVEKNLILRYDPSEREWEEFSEE